MPVIFLTSKDDEIDELFGLKMGADDFIKKPFSQRLLVERVKAVLRRFQPREASEKKSESRPRACSIAARCPWTRSVTPAPGTAMPVTLTVTEFLILYALAHRPGVVKSRNALDGRRL